MEATASRVGSEWCVESDWRQLQRARGGAALYGGEAGTDAEGWAEECVWY